MLIMNLAVFVFNVISFQKRYDPSTESWFSKTQLKNSPSEMSVVRSYVSDDEEFVKPKRKYTKKVTKRNNATAKLLDKDYRYRKSFRY